MKTIRRFEASDIDTKDPIHGFLFAELLIAAISASRWATDDPDHADDKLWGTKKAIADFLSRAEERGISITLAELPAVYR